MILQPFVGGSGGGLEVLASGSVTIDSNATENIRCPKRIRIAFIRSESNRADSGTLASFTGYGFGNAYIKTGNTSDNYDVYASVSGETTLRLKNTWTGSVKIYYLVSG